MMATLVILAAAIFIAPLFISGDEHYGDKLIFCIFGMLVLTLLLIAVFGLIIVVGIAL